MLAIINIAANVKQHKSITRMNLSLNGGSALTQWFGTNATIF